MYGRYKEYSRLPRSDFENTFLRDSLYVEKGDKRCKPIRNLYWFIFKIKFDFMNKMKCKLSAEKIQTILRDNRILKKYVLQVIISISFIYSLRKERRKSKLLKN